MILTITIDTHPHTNALIEGQVKRALEDFLADRQLGVVTTCTPAVDLQYVAERVRHALDIMPEDAETSDCLTEALEYLKGF